MLKINMLRNLFSFNRLAAAGGLTLLIFISQAGTLSAQTLTEGYASDETLQRGMLVAVKADNPTKVEALKNDSLERLKGVVVQPNDSPVTLSAEGQKVFVANVGTYEVLVSSENGPIKQGDYISVSSSAGIGMKASELQSVVIGRALSNFEGTNDTVASGTVSGQSGGDVKFGRVRVSVSISRNPQLKIPDKDKIPDVIQRVSQTIADKPVTAVRIYMALAVLVATTVIAGTTLYSGVRSSVVSIGRNPLSKSMIYKGLLQVVLMSLIIFLCGLFGVYLLLKL